ncbi:hypothetical protein ACT4S2_12650 [Kocuria turfanensis]|uniref:hypothetical protein n=1 Tax=Kocuria turfanensis TaxID=388357 RepID=UPI0040362571
MGISMATVAVLETRAGGDPQHHHCGHAHEAADRDGHRLADPQDDHAEQHRGQQVLGAVQVQRQQREDDRDAGGEEQTGAVVWRARSNFSNRERASAR